MDNLSAVQLAQKRVVEAALKQPMTPQGASISAFVNTTLLSCKVDALLAFLVDPIPELDYANTAQERFDQLLVAKLNEKADIFENTAREAPRILSSAHLAGHA